MSASAEPATPPRRAEALLFTGGYIALVLFWFRPVWREIARAVTPGDRDTWRNLDLLEWGYRTLLRGFRGAWTPPTRFLGGGNLALPDHLLGPAVLSAPLRALFGDEVATYNVLLLGSFVLSGALTFWVFRRRGLSAAASFAAGLVFSAAPFRWDQLSHLAVLWTQWLPLLLHAADELLAAPTPRRAAAFLAVYLLQVSGGPSLASLAHLPLLVVLAVHARDRGRELVSRDALRVLAPTALAAACLATLVFVPAWRTPGGAGPPPSPEEVRAHGATLASLTQPSTRNLYFSPEEWAGSWRTANALFAGFAAVALVCVSLYGILRRSVERHRGPLLPRWDRVMLGIAATGLLLCFADVYLPLARVAPGLSVVGVPTRFFAVALLAIAWLAGRGLDALLGAGASPPARRIAPWRLAVAGAFLALLLVESTPRALDWTAAPAEEVYPPLGG